MINPDLVEYVRTMIKGDHAANDQIEAKLDQSGWDGFPTLIGAVFYLAVNERFDERTPAAEIVRFVAEMRATAPAGAPEIDANAAELLITAALHPEIDTNIAPQMAGRIQGLTTITILGRGKAPDAKIDQLLAEAADLAGRF